MNTIALKTCVQYDDHPRVMSTALCKMMEHQSLVDLAICCGNKTMHAHKIILAASSPYFREQLEKNPGTEQVIINGLDFICMKSVLEFVYCGETVVLEKNMKYIVAAANLFQIQGLRALASNENSASDDEPVYIPDPIFLNKKPKYASAYVPFTPISQMIHPNQPNFQESGSVLDANCSTYRGVKRNKKSQGDEYAAELGGVPMQVVNYGGPSTSMMSAPSPELNKSVNEDVASFVEVVYQMPEGEYLQVTDEVFRNITGETLRFQGPTAAQTANDSVEMTNDEHLQTFDHEHADILSEINSMQYYDNSVYEDVAERVELAFQRQQHQPQQEVAQDEGKLPDLN